MAKRIRKKGHKIVLGLRQAIAHVKKTPKVLGRMEKFDDGRIVFLGAREDMPVHFVGFVNQLGSVIKFTISDEALNALIQLRTNPDHGTKGEFPMPKTDVQFEWKIIESETR